MEKIPHSKPTIGENESSAVQRSVASAQLSADHNVQEFERLFSGRMGVKEAVCVSSGTAALHVALIALGIKAGDEVILPSYVCPALLNAIHYVQASPRLVDVDYYDGNISLEATKNAINKRTKAIIVPHMFGEPADIKPLLNLGIPIIEDCAHSVGAKYLDKYVGSYGKIAVYSFYATKMMTTGEGGMVTSNDKKMIATIRDLISYDHKDKYRVRFNYKMTDFQAALGIAQLQKLDAMIAQRRRIARFYTEHLKGLDVVLPQKNVVKEPAYYRYVVKVRKGADGFIKKMKAKDIAVERPVFYPLHRYLALRGFPITEKLYKESLSLPLYPFLTGMEARRVLKEFHASFFREK